MYREKGCSEINYLMKIDESFIINDINLEWKEKKEAIHSYV
jgi:hypothetical protein